jgi:hypothetical protein
LLFDLTLGDGPLLFLVRGLVLMTYERVTGSSLDILPTLVDFMFPEIEITGVLK